MFNLLALLKRKQQPVEKTAPVPTLTREERFALACKAAGEMQRATFQARNGLHIDNTPLEGVHLDAALVPRGGPRPHDRPAPVTEEQRRAYRFEAACRAAGEMCRRTSAERNYAHAIFNGQWFIGADAITIVVDG